VAVVELLRLELLELRITVVLAGLALHLLLLVCL
jgi:hypothetical protein